MFQCKSNGDQWFNRSRVLACIWCDLGWFSHGLPWNKGAGREAQSGRKASMVRLGDETERVRKY